MGRLILITVLLMPFLEIAGFIWVGAQIGNMIIVTEYRPSNPGRAYKAIDLDSDDYRT